MRCLIVEWSFSLLRGGGGSEGLTNTISQESQGSNSVAFVMNFKFYFLFRFFLEGEEKNPTKMSEVFRKYIGSLQMSH